MKETNFSYFFISAVLTFFTPSIGLYPQYWSLPRVPLAFPFYSPAILVPLTFFTFCHVVVSHSLFDYFAISSVLDPQCIYSVFHYWQISWVLHLFVPSCISISTVVLISCFLQLLHFWNVFSAWSFPPNFRSVQNKYKNKLSVAPPPLPTFCKCGKKIKLNGRNIYLCFVLPVDWALQVICLKSNW
jgi:hypothetical protein